MLVRGSIKFRFALRDYGRVKTSPADRGDAATLARRLRLFYFSYFVAVGIYYPFLVPHLRSIGLGGSEIGTAQMASSVAAIPASFLWGALADRLQAPARALQWATRAAFVAACALVFARTPMTVAILLFALGLAAPAIIPLVDTVAVDSLHTRPGASYARLRLFGSLGFIVSAQGFGLFLALIGESAQSHVMPFGYAAALFVAALGASAIPSHRLEPRPKPHFGDARLLLHDRRLAVFLVAGAVHAATTATYQLYGTLVHDRGLSPAVTGAGMAFGVVVEVLVLFFFPVLERRLSIATLLGFAFAGSALRWWLVSRAPAAGSLIAIQAFHGLTFGLYWAVAVKALTQWVPARLRATGQALFSSISWSLGGAIGYRVAGWGYERLGGATPVYAWAAAVELAAVALGLLLWRREPPAVLVLKKGEEDAH
jgi:PPP family 3-phenylpropionic acid transporter